MDNSDDFREICQPIKLKRMVSVDDDIFYECGKRKGFKLYAQEYENTLGEDRVVFYALKNKPENDNLGGKTYVEADKYGFYTNLSSVDYDISLWKDAYDSVIKMVDNVKKEGKVLHPDVKSAIKEAEKRVKVNW